MPHRRSSVIARVHEVFGEMERRYANVAAFREPESGFLIEEFRGKVLGVLRADALDDVVDTLQTLHHKHSFFIQKCHETNVPVRTVDVAAVFLCDEALKESRRMGPPSPGRSGWCVPFGCGL